MEALKVLVVDDEPGICSGIQRVLRNFSVGFPFVSEQIGFYVNESFTGENAMEIIESQPIDIVLLDNKLPGVQGIDILGKITANYPQTLVIFITSYASLDLAAKANTSGAFDFLPKPFTPAELKSIVESAAKHVYIKRMTAKMNKEGKQIRYQFLSVLSHELKSPLNAIEGYLKMMSNRQFGNDLNKYNEMLDRSLARVSGMRALIMDMLDLTRIESGKKNRDIKETNITQIAREAIDINEPMAIQRDVKISLLTSKKITMLADPEEIAIIINNLVSNAVKYNKENGKVGISLASDHDTVTIKVSDTGIGLAEDEIPKLFEDFVRIKNEKTRQISGSGLGLSIVRKIAGLYHGDINVQSIPGEGSTFTVKLKT